MVRLFGARLIALLLVAGVSACGGGGSSSSPAIVPAATPTPSPLAAAPLQNSPIKHIVLVVQENRSFDNLFGAYPGADGATTWTNSSGQQIPLTTIHLEDGIDPVHNHASFEIEYDGGKMDGFVSEGSVPPSGVTVPPNYALSIVNSSEIASYYTLAQQYTLADHLFQSQTSGSFTSHQYLIAGTTQISPGLSMIDFPTSTPWGCDAPAGTTVSTINSSETLSLNGPFPCVTQYRTLADLLDQSGISWRYYAPTTSDIGGQIWTAFDAISNVRYGPDWSNVSTPETNILTDIANGNLASMNWVVPDLANSDHPSSGSNTGPSWVMSIVNAIGNSQYWNSTAIVIVWDDWGGWYDHVTPPQLDYNGFGFRVPMLVVSPYAKKGYISHTQYEFGSILSFVEQNFGLASLGTTDARANSIVDCFNFAQTPTPYATIRAPYDRTYFLHQRPSYKVVDDE